MLVNIDITIYLRFPVKNMIKIATLILVSGGTPIKQAHTTNSISLNGFIKWNTFSDLTSYGEIQLAIVYKSFQ